MKIAVDFDGTIVENKYPEIGAEKLFAFATLKEMQKLRHQLILWTCRTGQELDDAVQFCKKNGLEFYAVGQDYPEEIFNGDGSRKIDADMYIDDKNFGGFPGWNVIWDQFRPDKHLDDINGQMRSLQLKKASFIQSFAHLFKTKKNV